MSALPNSVPEWKHDEGAISAERYKDLLAHIAGAVAVITTRDASRRNWGFTASSFCSLSLEPPLVLFCLSQDADCAAAFATAGCFAVSILTARQVDISERFAGKGESKYTGVSFATGPLGLPLLPGALAWLECRVVARYPGGDHTIVVGQVERGDIEGDSDGDTHPLLYYKRGYGTFVPGKE